MAVTFPKDTHRYRSVYEDAYLLCYIRGPEGLLIGLAQELGG